MKRYEIFIGVTIILMLGLSICIRTFDAIQLSKKMVEYVVIVDENQYDVVIANEFFVDDNGTLIFTTHGKNESSYACGYWTRVFDKRNANIEKEETSTDPIQLEVTTEEEETNVDQGVSP
jgi:hypothetical protein